MYKIIGADGKEYGPITANQLCQWVTQGRANALTKVRPEAESEWRPLGTFPEFAEALAQPPTLPNLPAAAPTAAKTSGMAIASLVLGVLGIACGLTTIVGLVLGIVALTKINKSQGQLAGRGLAIAGIVVSSLMLAVSLLILPALLLPALAKAKAKAQSISCMNNARQLALAVIIHTQDNTNTCPPAATWCDAIQPEVGSASVFQCPAGDKSHQSHYAYNAKLSGFNLDEVKDSAQTVLFFETDGGWNLSGGSELLPRKPRHNGVVIVAFVDGHVERVQESHLPQLQWEP